MRRFFARNALFIVGINLLIKPVWVFAIDRTVQNKLGHAEYGLYSALLNLAIVFQILLDFGLNSYASRRISANPARLRGLFPSLLGARVMLMGIYAAVVLAIAWMLGYRGAALALLCSALVIQSLSILLLFLRSNVAALHRFRLDGLLSVADRSLMILICGAMLLVPAWSASFSIWHFVAAQTASLLLAVVFGMAVLRRISKVRLWPALHPKVVLPIIRRGLPYALLIFLMAVHMRSDTMLIERLAGKALDGAVEAGIYTQSLRLLDVGNMVAIMIAGVLLPLFGRMLAKGNDVAPIVRLSVNILLPVSLTGLAMAAAFGQNIMTMLYRDVNYDAGIIFGTLMIAFPAYSLSNVYATLLTAAGKLRLLNIISAVGVVTSLGINLTILPYYGAFGAAVAAAITQSVVAILNVIIAHRETALKSQPRWIGAHLLYAAALGATALLCSFLPGDWRLRALLLGGAGALFTLPFRFIDLKAARAIFRQA